LDACCCASDLCGVVPGQKERPLSATREVSWVSMWLEGWYTQEIPTFHGLQPDCDNSQNRRNLSQSWLGIHSIIRSR